MMLLAALGGGSAALTRESHAQAPREQERQRSPRELGDVRWSRDFDASVRRAESEKKPLLVLFDEVPGCHTCVSYGETVLSHPLVVDAAEQSFIPVAIYNNASDGADRRVLELFGEPAWNNPVVRIIDAKRNALTPRINGEYTARGITLGMVDALAKSGRPVPTYLELLAAELRATPERAVLGMHCFWEGEARLGAIEGVLSTHAGFLDGREVVEVTYDPAVVSFDRLVKAAAGMQCATNVFTRSDEQHRAARAIVGDAARRSDVAVRPAPESDQKHSTRGTVYAGVPMTGAQAARVNASLHEGLSPERFLSPSQIALAKKQSSAEGGARFVAIGRTDLAQAFRDARVAAQR